ncbi:hypothetical protein [Priestia aryabhattai]
MSIPFPFLKAWIIAFITLELTIRGSLGKLIEAYKGTWEMKHIMT